MNPSPQQATPCRSRDCACLWGEPDPHSKGDSCGFRVRQTWGRSLSCYSLVREPGTFLNFSESLGCKMWRATPTPRGCAPIK